MRIRGIRERFYSITTSDALVPEVCGVLNKRHALLRERLHQHGREEDSQANGTARDFQQAPFLYTQGPRLFRWPWQYARGRFN